MAKCVQCGYCCEFSPCAYGESRASDDYACIYLSHPDKFGQHKCLIYDQIVEAQKDSPTPMMGSGCSSTMFNGRRDLVVKKLERRKA